MSISTRQISALFVAVAGKGYRSSPELKTLEQRLVQALKRNSGPRNARDGYPTGGSGSGQDGGDPVGAVATSNVSKFPLKDPLAEHLEAAAGYLEQAAASMGAFASRLNAIDRLTDDSKLDPDAACWAMARIGEFEPAHVTSDAKGAIKEPKPWGRWAYEFALATGQPPTVEQCRDHADGRRVKLRAS